MFEEGVAVGHAGEVIGDAGGDIVALLPFGRQAFGFGEEEGKQIFQYTPRFAGHAVDFVMAVDALHQKCFERFKIRLHFG